MFELLTASGKSLWNGTIVFFCLPNTGAKKKRQRLSKLASSSEDPEHPELE